MARRLNGRASMAMEDIIALADSSADRCENIALLISQGNKEAKILAELLRILNSQKKIMKLGANAIQNRYEDEN